MRRRRLLLVAGVVLLLGLAALPVVWQALPPRQGVTPENFYRIRRGMTEQEVEAILGGPGAWDPSPCIVREGWQRHRAKGWGTGARWPDDTEPYSLITVYFDKT